jgi:hypothetical protein
VTENEADRAVEKSELRIDPVQLKLELIKLRHELLIFDRGRPHAAQIPAAMSANESFVLDRLCAERAFHWAASQ